MSATRLIPYLGLPNARAAIVFYSAALGASTQALVNNADGSVLHAELAIGAAVFMLSDTGAPPPGPPHTPPQQGTVGLRLEVSDVDALYAQALSAGATGLVPPEDAPWGERFATFIDPFDVVWHLAAASS